jgi:hypothetical protein
MGFLILIAAASAAITLVFTHRFWLGLSVSVLSAMPLWTLLNMASTHPLSQWNDLDFIYWSVLLIVAVYSVLYWISAKLR